MYLSKGFHDLKLEYYENGGEAQAKLYFSSPSITKQIIPSANLCRVEQIITYTYDAKGRKTKITYPDGKVTSFEYDADDRLIKTTQSDN